MSLKWADPKGYGLLLSWPVLKNVIVLKIGPEPSVNERSIETPKTTPKLDSTTANHHKTSYHMQGSRKFSLWVGRADGSTKFTIRKKQNTKDDLPFYWLLSIFQGSEYRYNETCQHAVILATLTQHKKHLHFWMYISQGNALKH